jgi:hypothetical protein
MHMRIGIVAGIAALSLAACGGGGSGGSSNPPPPPPVTLQFSANSGFVSSGQNVTLTWTSSGTRCTASGDWSGAKSASGSELVGPLTQNSTYTIACSATATSTPSTSSAAVNVIGTTPPPPSTSRVYSRANSSYLDYARFQAKVTDMVWDPTRSLLFLITKSNSTFAPNSLASIEPVSRATQVLPLTAEPTTLAISADGQFIYVGFAGGGGVRRIRAAGLVPDLSIAVGTANTRVHQISVSPQAPRTIAVVADRLIDQPMELNGLVIFDDAVPRPDRLHGRIELSPTQVLQTDIASANWTPDGATIHAPLVGLYNKGILKLAVSSQGVSLERWRTWPFQGAGRLYGNRIFGDYSFAVDLDGPIELLGITAEYDDFANYRIESLANGKVFSTQRHISDAGPFLDGMTITAYDAERFHYVDSVVFNGAADTTPGLIRLWGNDGLAVAGENYLLIASGSFAGAGGVPPDPGVAPVGASGTVSDGGSSVNYRSLDMSAVDVVADTCGHLYASTSSHAPSRRNSVVEINLTTGNLGRSVPVGSRPDVLAASDDCSTLYSGLYASNSITRVRVADMSVDARIPLGGDFQSSQAFSRARSIAVAPGQAQTIAVAKGDIGNSFCDGTDHGLVLFDGTTRRPVPFEGNTFGIKTVAFGDSAGILYGEDWQNINAFDVEASGAVNPRPLLPSRGSGIHDMGRDLHFDRGLRRLYTPFGQVYDAANDRELPMMPLVDPPSVLVPCGTPSVAMTSDATTGRSFYVSMGATYGDIGVAVFGSDQVLQSRFELRANLVPGGWGVPMRAAKPDANTLAFVTSRGYLVILDGAAL